MLVHERAIHRIGKYLLGNKERGIIYNPKHERGIECFVDADFAGSWTQADSKNAENVLSQTGFVLMYSGCPVMWMRKLQTEISLSTTEAEYIAMSQSMREVIPFMGLMAELSKTFALHLPKPIIKCKVYEDNNSCIAVANATKFSPRTKHIALKYHHFRSFVKKGIIEIFPIASADQVADIFTKPLDIIIFSKLRKLLNGW